MTFLPEALPKITERRFQGQVIRLAEMLGWKVRHDNATNAPRKCQACGAELHIARNAPGMLDLLLIRRPRVVWAELKSDRGKLTDDQWKLYEELKACGQEAYIWRPIDWARIERILR